MAEYSNLSATINAQIRANGVQAITGPVLNAVLTAMVNVLGDGYRLNGVAVPADNPGSPDNRVAYLAAQDGTYTNFGGLTISGEVALLLWDSAWTKEVLFSIDTAVTPGSGHLVTSGAVDDALTTLAGNIAAAYMQLVPGATEDNLASYDGAGQVKDSGIAAADVVVKDGVYPDLFAGYAGNLVDTRSAGTPQGPYAFRQSGGDGVDYMVRIKGRTEAFNQLFDKSLLYASQTYKGVTAAGNIDTGAITFSGTATGNEQFNLTAMSQVKMVVGHKYLLRGATANTPYLRLADQTAVFDTGNGMIWTCNRDNTPVTLSCAIVSGRTYSGTIYVKIVDLTLMYGVGNEPATVAAFEALHPLPYYNYNAGVLKNNAATGIKSRGFNQWDEEWKYGSIDTNGEEQASNALFISKNYIPVFGGQTYYFHVGSPSIPSTCIYIRYYDSNKNYLGGTDKNGRANGANTTRVMPDNCAFIRFGTQTGYPSLPNYAYDICINLSDASRNGEYEPYWERDIVLGLTGVTGIPEGGTEADRVTIFPDGLAGVGTAQDMFYEENGVAKAKMVMPEVDLGDLAGWSAANAQGVTYTVVPGMKYSALGNTIICAKYYTKTVAGVVDKTVSLTVSSLYLIDSALAGMTSAQVAAALAGVKLRFELATPIVYTDLQNADGTPFVFPKMIEVDNLGTEKRLPEDTADNPQGGFESDSNYSVSTANLVRLLNL